MSFLLLFVAIEARAQVGDRRDNFAVGVNAGYTLSNVNFVPKVTQGYHMGPSFGLSMRYTSEKYFSLLCSVVGEVNYNQLGWNENIIDINDNPVCIDGTNEQKKYSRTINYIQVPLLAHLAWGHEKRGLQYFVNLGPQFGYMTGESTSYNYDLSTAGSDDRSNKTRAQYEMDVEKKYDYGIVAGLGAELVTGIGRFMVEGRYYYGLGNIYGATHSDYFARSNNSAIELKVGYLIELAK